MICPRRSLTATTRGTLTESMAALTMKSTSSRVRTLSVGLGGTVGMDLGSVLLPQETRPIRAETTRMETVARAGEIDQSVDRGRNWGTNGGMRGSKPRWTRRTTPFFRRLKGKPNGMNQLQRDAHRLTHRRSLGQSFRYMIAATDRAHLGPDRVSGDESSRWALWRRRLKDGKPGSATLRGGESTKGAAKERRRQLARFAWQAAAIAAVATCAVYGASRTTTYSDTESRTYDFTVLSGSDETVSKDVVLVDFDEESFRRIAVFPIPRNLMADVVRRIGAMNPKIVGMDILLSEPRSEDEDQAMQAALTSAGVVILAKQKGTGVLPPEVPLTKFCQPEDPKAASGFCKEGAPGALGYGFIDLVFSDDGFIPEGECAGLGTAPVGVVSVNAGGAVQGPADRVGEPQELSLSWEGSFTLPETRPC